jgi:hypothetical protein
VANDGAFAMLTSRLHNAHLEPRRTRRDHRIWGSSRVHLRKELDLEVLAFRSVLLDKVRVRERML